MVFVQQVAGADCRNKNRKPGNQLACIRERYGYNGDTESPRPVALPMESPMQSLPLRNVKPGEFVRRKQDAKTTYIKGGYDRASKTFSLTDFDDINREIFVKASTVVWVGFDF